MPQIVQIKSPILAVITDRTGYVKARKEAEKLSAEHGLRVADMPMVIQAMTNHSDVREAIRPTFIDTITGEYHGLREGDHSYEVWHSVGSLATAKGLERAFSEIGQYGFMQIAPDEWVAVGNGNFNGQDVARIHLDDVKKGKVPSTGTPYTVFTQLNKANINASDQLIYDAFMQDDRVLMIAGSPDAREALAKILFGKKEDGGEGRSTIGSYHGIKEVGFNDQARGRLVYLSNYDSGFFGLNLICGYGRFVGVGAGGVVRERTKSQSIEHPTLDQTLAIINNPDLDRGSMVQAVSKLYQL